MKTGVIARMNFLGGERSNPLKRLLRSLAVARNDTNLDSNEVKRNLKRFPGDFMFRLTKEEAGHLISHFAISRWGGRRTRPFAFTEQGIAMLSSVLNSDQAIAVNIQIMRVFTKLREFMISHKDFARKIEDLERKFNEHDKKFVLVFEAIKQLLKESEESSKTKEPIGFHARK